MCGHGIPGPSPARIIWEMQAVLYSEHDSTAAFNTGLLKSIGINTLRMTKQHQTAFKFRSSPPLHLCPNRHNHPQTAKHNSHQGCISCTLNCPYRSNVPPLMGLHS